MSRKQHVRMVLLGRIYVGKSALALRFAKGDFTEHLGTTIGAAFFTRQIDIEPDISLRIELWDTAGQERYHSLAPMYYRGAQAAIVVFAITDSESWRCAKVWVRELRDANGNDMIIGIAGNKLDLAVGNERQVSHREVLDYAEENNLIFLETSAKRGDNVEEIFLRVARAAGSKQNGTQQNGTLRGNDLGKKSNAHKRRCCSGSNTDVKNS